MRGCFYLSILIGALSGFFAGPVQAVGPELFDVGAARAEITPRFPVRLSGFGFRRQESEGVYQRLWVKALAIGRDQPTVLLTVDNLGVPASLVDELARRLTNRGVTRERLVVSATHTHTAPMLSNACPTLFGVAIPAEQQENIDRYTRDFVDKLEKAALDALADRQPSRLFWGVGKVGFATNRRTPGGPVDQDLPVLVVRSGHGKLRALWVNYACHAVTLSHNKAGGDWPGYAQQALEDDHPGAIALVSIGCGADSNPSSGVTGDKVEIASRQGMEIAQEVKRLLAGYLAPLQGPLRASRRSISLPLEHLPSRDEWEKRANRTDAIGYHARVQLARLNRGEKLKTHIDYPITTWTFGGGLGMAFLPGEVVVDYSTRLKKELDSSRLWISAYSNDAPCYIPSERILGEGGYEGGGAMVYYDVPAHLRSGLEDKIVTTVRDLLGKEFAPSFDTSKVNALPLSPHQSLSTIRTHPGHKVLLAAAEPLVSSPVAINFAPDGRVFVAEMVDYPAGRAGKFEPGGRISVLSDSDGDGILDRSTVFLDNIPFPTAVTIWRGGVLVCAAPDILYAEDTDGDGKADRVEKRFSGFGADNYQARVNSLEYGLDGWLHGSCGLFGGSILSHRTGKVIKLGDRDFRLNPDTGDIEAATGRTQQGRVRDDFDNWFGCDNSTLAWHYVLPDHYLRRNPHVGYPNTTRFLADYPDSHRLYPIRAVQMFKLSGPPNMVTAACGIGVYRDDLLGKDLTGNLFTCESVNLLVHRLTLQPNGSTFAARRAPGEASREFVASSDSWMRPVQARTGPDGALWIVDMHRFVIEHPRWIPPEDLAKVDSRAGAGLGRILRVCPVEGPTRPMPRLNRMSPAELASALDNKNGTVRDLAVQMLLWHRDSAPAIPVLRRLAMESEYPEVRVQAMHTLAHLKALGREDVERALSHPHPGVRRHAIKLMEGFLDQPGVGKALVKRVDDSDPQVRLQLAFTLGNWHDPEAGRALARMLAHPSADEYLLSAIWSGVGKHNLHLLVHSVLSEPTPLPDRLRPLLQTAVGLGETEILSKVLRILAEKYPDGSANGFRLLSDVLEVANTRGLRVGEFLTAEDQKILSRWRNQARKHVQQTDVPELDRLAAISVLGRVALGQQEDLDLLAELLGPRETPSVQGAAIQSLGSLSASESADALLSRWKNLTPNTRNQVLDVLLGRRAWREKLLTALEKKQMASSQIDAARRQRLLSDSDAGIRERATRLLASSAGGDRRAMVVSHAPALRLPGDVGRGKAVFSRACASCHRLENVGHDVGPDLAALANKTPPYLLQEILDPNRNVDSRYLQYIAVMATGQSHSGLLAQETATSLTLRMQDGRTITLLRNNVEELQETGKSFMPEGLEKDLSHQDLADLIAYLTRQARPPRSFPGNQPQVVTLTPSGGVLPASAAALFGTEIAFEQPHGNIGMWHGPEDHAVWTVRLKESATFDVWLDWSCANDVAGNPFVLDGGKQALSGSIPGTEGWENYQLKKFGQIHLPEGESRLIFRPDTPPRGALTDLRGLVLVAPGGKPAVGNTGKEKDAKALAREILDDTIPSARREAVIEANKHRAALVILAMAEGLGSDAKEEYRRIPWIWRMAITASKSSDTNAHRHLLDVSMPRGNASLNDWQAVVLGGGLINGLSQQGIWPRPRVEQLLRDLPDGTSRWNHTLKEAFIMADNAKVPTGTRYDALRMVALAEDEKSLPCLSRYLAKGTDDELMMGAISGLSDVSSDQVAGLLLGALRHCSRENRSIAMEALRRNDQRVAALLEALEKKRVPLSMLADRDRKSLREWPRESLRRRAVQLLQP